MRLSLLFLSLFIYSGLFAQDCNTRASSTSGVVAIDAADVKCIAESSSKSNTLFYTFGIWCEPCRLHLPNAIKLAKDHNLDFYVLIVDAEGTDKANQAVAYLKKLDKNLKVAIYKNDVYGDKTQKRNKQFVKEITPKQFETIDDFSKYILLNKKGEVIMVTNWKDNKDNDWKDDSKMIQKRIIPLLK